MSIAKSFAVGLSVSLAYLVVFDIAGVVASFVFDVLPLAGVSTALFYAVWLVAGVFCGLLSFEQIGSRISGPGETDWSNRPGCRRVGAVALASTTVALACVAVLCYRLMWVRSMENSYVVPDSLPLTIVFFVAILGSAIFGQSMLKPMNGPIEAN